MKSNETTGAAGAMCASISARVLEMAVQRGIDTGIKSAMSYIDTERKKARKERQDRRLHNTRLLLKNYRILKIHAKNAISSSNQIKAAGENAIGILDSLDADELTDGLYIESIKKSQERTAIILSHIDMMMELYRAYCYNTGNAEDIRRYRVIMENYIEEPKKSAQDIADTYGIEKRTVFKDITTAIKPITALFFGIDSMKF